MKKALYLICMFLTVLTFVSCARAADEGGGGSYFERPFTLTADFERQGLSGTLAFDFFPPERGELRFIMPNELCGMTLKREGEVVLEEYLGISSETEYESLERGNPLVALLRVFTALRRGDIEPQSTAEGELYELADGSRLLAVSGVPRRIEVPSAEFFCTVTSFEYLDG